MKKIIQLIALLFCCLSFNFAQTLSSLWSQYKANPYNHPNIPNNSYSGYGTGITLLPNPSSTPVDVTKSPYNARPNDNSNDQPAIQKAIDAVGAAGGGIVYLPAGTYTLQKPLFIKYSNVIVRGQESTGSKATILDFKFSVYSAYKSDIASDKARYLWWSTGLVWIGPADTYKSNGAPNVIGGFERWRYSETLATVTKTANPGDFSITVNNASSLKAGMKVLLTYQLPSDRSLIKHIYGHAPTESRIDNKSYVGDCSNLTYPKASLYTWPAQIKSISGNVVTFDRPLRLKVDPNRWPALIRKIRSIVTESGIENVQLKGYNTTKMAHLPTPTTTGTSGKATLGGWNGVYINRSWNCWAKNIRLVNMENGVILADAKNCSVLNTFITSTDANHWYHHPYTVRDFSSDNLIEGFTIDGPGNVRHGISTESYSSGTVYSKGLLKVGTFDTHRGATFDIIRTEITVANDYGASSGGDADSGPYAGKRFAHWNIIQKMQPGYPYSNSNARSGDNIFEPLQYPMSTFVGISGPRDNSVGEFVPPPLSGGTLGAVVVTGSISDAGLINLYHAELALRKAGTLKRQAAQFDLNVSTNGHGMVSQTTSDNAYESGDKITLTAIPAEGQEFTGWGGDITGNLNPLTITMDANKTIVANFRIKDPLALLEQNKIVKAGMDPVARIKSSLGIVQVYDPSRVKMGTVKGTIASNAFAGVKGLNKEGLQIKLAPNPAVNILNIAAAGPQNKKQASLSIISSSGTVIKTIRAASLLQTIQLDVSSLPAGVYTLRLASGDKVMYKQFVKL